MSEATAIEAADDAAPCFYDIRVDAWRPIGQADLDLICQRLDALGTFRADVKRLLTLSHPATSEGAVRVYADLETGGVRLLLDSEATVLTRDAASKLLLKLQGILAKPEPTP